MTETEPGNVTGCPSGIYSVDAATRDRIVRGEAFLPGYFMAILDGDAAGSREAFFTEIAHALHFPDYFGRNWDAVYDCLTDLSWLPGTGHVILLDGYSGLAVNDPAQWQIALKVLRDACAFWRPLQRHMIVLLSGAGPDPGGIAPLPASCLAHD